MTDIRPEHVEALAAAAQRYADDGHILAARRAARQATEAAQHVPDGERYLTLGRAA